MQHLYERKGIRQSTEQFEEWLQRKKMMRSQRAQALREQAGPYKIPVVFHIIHNGEPVGTGSNVSDARIYSQLEVLNKDFTRTNADANETPSEFLPVAGAMDIEFVLAKQTPEGQATTGINRVDGNQPSWSPFDSDMNALSYWPSEDYFNIWVTNIGGDFLGYAQFPYSTTVPGLIGESDDIAETDGVVIDYTVFGVGSPDPDYNEGRTATHEVAHFFGLRHIWGDTQNCSGTDYISDTPNQASETYGCEEYSHPEADACSSMKMYQNYMDYTDDECMNLFTVDQVDRMILILEDTDIPRRNSLLTSIGLDEPIPGTIDLQVLGMTRPGPVTCDDTPALHLDVANLGNETITELKVRINANDGSTETITLTGLSIDDTEEILVPSPALEIGDNTVFVNIVQINGATDPNPANNQMEASINVIYPECEPFAIYRNDTGGIFITFDLENPGPVTLSIVDVMGREITSGTFSDVLNQTIEIPGTGSSTGMYIVRLFINNRYYTTKIYLSP